MNFHVFLSIGQEHEFPLASVPSVTFLPFAVRRLLPLSARLSRPGRGGGGGRALDAMRRGRRLRQVMLQKGGVEGHGCHGDGAAAAAAAALVQSVVVRVVAGLRFCWTKERSKRVTSLKK